MEKSQLEKLKAELSDYPKHGRDVAMWNEARELLKAKYTHDTIIKLDTSGYISKWLKEEHP